MNSFQKENDQQISKMNNYFIQISLDMITYFGKAFFHMFS